MSALSARTDLPGWLRARARLWWLAAVLLVAGALWQIAAPNGDLYQYRCDAVAFWRGSAGTAGIAQCALRLPLTHFPPLHLLPHEYPPLALIAFTLPLLLGGGFGMTAYVLAFNALMLAALAGTALLVRRIAPDTLAESLFVLWTALGATTIALVRFDAVPALLVALALALAWRAPSRWAYPLLALGTLLKLYPLLILAALALWDWRRTRATADRWWWAQGLAVAAAVIAVLQLAANALSGQRGIPWLSVQGARPPQIESTAAGLVWLLAVLGGRGGTLQPQSVQRAVAFIDPLGLPLARLTLAVALVGIAWGLWRTLTARGTLAMNLAGMLLALLGGANIFSPQYLLWATPLVALAVVDLPAPRRLILAWTVACALTTVIYSVGYLAGWPAHAGGWLALFMTLVLIRDGVVWWSAWLLLRPTPRTIAATATGAVTRAAIEQAGG